MRNKYKTDKKGGLLCRLFGHKVIVYEIIDDREKYDGTAIQEHYRCTRKNCEFTAFRNIYKGKVSKKYSKPKILTVRK